LGPLWVVGIRRRCGWLRLRRDRGHEQSMSLTLVHALEPLSREAPLPLSAHMLSYVQGSHLFPVPLRLARPGRLPCDRGQQKD
jgi:hypothetical protein